MDYVYCYVVCVNDGFYMEPDISVDKVFLNHDEAVNYCKKIADKHYSGCFIVKRRISLKRKE